MSKYKAEKITIDGYTFDSKVEAKYYEKLKDDKAKGLIINFELQPRYELQPPFKAKGKSYRRIEYVGDFLVYRVDGTHCVIDIKGLATETAKLKKKMFEYLNKDKELELHWVVWNKGKWQDYDEVIKDRAKRKRSKL